MGLPQSLDRFAYLRLLEVSLHELPGAERAAALCRGGTSFDRTDEQAREAMISATLQAARVVLEELWQAAIADTIGAQQVVWLRRGLMAIALSGHDRDRVKPCDGWDMW